MLKMAATLLRKAVLLKTTVCSPQEPILVGKKRTDSKWKKTLSEAAMKVG